VANTIVSASCAAVLAVYAAGYARTQSAADRFSKQVAERRVPARPAQRLVVVPQTVDPAPVVALAPPAPPPALKIARVEPPKLAPKLAEAPVVTAETPAPPPLPPPPPPVVELKPAVVAAPVPAIIPPPVIIPAPAPIPPPAPKWKDGTYTGWGYSRHGNIEAEVVIESGRISSAVISQCRTRYSCNVIEKLPPEVAQRQSPDVDYVSGATQSADAFYGAVVEALAKAK
jgi:uncharacterized protein with FMN-binding domain